ncbi:Integrase catalytic domain-containing protein [Aphis craccivora]|uniref:Integrase catalytic domain-containing protein n=1 Tax=Aphis craccivora TaxID=307492 RepID=A0A6G0XZK3_APHCR|nr:Integrase catalytic domain-containing protein [Aphis craccivora]
MSFLQLFAEHTSETMDEMDDFDTLKSNDKFAKESPVANPHLKTKPHVLFTTNILHINGPYEPDTSVFTSIRIDSYTNANSCRIAQTLKNKGKLILRKREKLTEDVINRYIDEEAQLQLN